ncbi:MAG: S8 family serine peptidase [Luteimonas sp.]
MNTSSRNRATVRTTLALAVSAGLALSFSAQAAGQVSPDLQQRMATAGTHEVVVTFSDRSQMSRLAALTASVHPMKELPMAGAILTSAQINTVASWDGVESIYFNAPLKYINYEAGEITGGHRVHDQIALKGNGFTVAVIDSGIDGNHPDVQFGSKTVQNVKIVADLGLVGVGANVENVPNTDTSSGHGTHVAGTVAGTGAASAVDSRRLNYYAGIAPQASLIGLGVGEGINILFALQAFDYALANQQRYSIDVITNSWGSSNSVYDPNNPINKASYEAYKRGMVVAFAAGNDGPDEDTLNPYAIVPWVINVGSGTKTGDLSNFSSRGVAGDLYKHVDVVAPGSNICSTRAIGTAIGALGPVVNAAHPRNRRVHDQCWRRRHHHQGQSGLGRRRRHRLQPGGSGRQRGRFRRQPGQSGSAGIRGDPAGHVHLPGQGLCDRGGQLHPGQHAHPGDRQYAALIPCSSEHGVHAAGGFRLPAAVLCAAAGWGMIPTHPQHRSAS